MVANEVKEGGEEEEVGKVNSSGGGGDWGGEAAVVVNLCAPLPVHQQPHSLQCTEQTLRTTQSAPWSRPVLLCTTPGPLPPNLLTHRPFTRPPCPPPLVVHHCSPDHHTTAGPPASPLRLFPPRPVLLVTFVSPARVPLCNMYSGARSWWVQWLPRR